MGISTGVGKPEILEWTWWPLLNKLTGLDFSVRGELECFEDFKHYDSNFT